MSEPKPKRGPKPKSTIVVAVLREERARIIQYCKMAIQVYTPLCTPDDADTSLHGRIEGYRDILRQMGEIE